MIWAGRAFQAFLPPDNLPGASYHFPDGKTVRVGQVAGREFRFQLDPPSLAFKD